MKLRWLNIKDGWKLQFIETSIYGNIPYGEWKDIPRWIIGEDGKPEPLMEIKNDKNS